MRNFVAHIDAVAVVVLMLGALEAAAQSPEIPRDTVLPIARTADTVSRDTTVKDTAAASKAPSIRTTTATAPIWATELRIR